MKPYYRRMTDDRTEVYWANQLIGLITAMERGAGDVPLHMDLCFEDGTVTNSKGEQVPGVQVVSMGTIPHYGSVEGAAEKIANAWLAYKIPLGSVWRHFKGNLYSVMFLSKSTDNPDQTLVTYRKITAEREDIAPVAWTRRLEEFLGHIEPDEMVKRLEAGQISTEQIRWMDQHFPVWKEIPTARFIFIQ